MIQHLLLSLALLAAPAASPAESNRTMFRCAVGKIPDASRREVRKLYLSEGVQATRSVLGSREMMAAVTPCVDKNITEERAEWLGAALAASELMGAAEESLLTRHRVQHDSLEQAYRRLSKGDRTALLRLGKPDSTDAENQAGKEAVLRLASELSPPQEEPSALNVDVYVYSMARAHLQREVDGE